MSFLESWAPYFQTHARLNGRADQMAGKVVAQPSGPNQCIRAEVRGDPSHAVTIGTQVAAQCTCDHFAGGAYCRHIWAVLLDTQNNRTGATDAKWIDSIRPTFLKARKRRGRKEPNPDPDWLERLSLLQSSARRNAAESLPKLLNREQVCYVVNVERSGHREALVIDLRQRQPTQSGWTTMKPLKVNASSLDELKDSDDRRIVASLLGADRVVSQELELLHESGRRHDAFVLKPAGQRELMRRMADTGRCFVDDKGLPTLLTWDAFDETSWSLWLVAQETESGVDFDLALRRDEQRMKIAEPQLVVVGPEGVVIYDHKVAPFDDLDASRWVSQFRDEQSYYDEALHVPRSDVERFLDHLYRLPNLPQLDLPPGIGRPHEPILPQANLDLFAHSSELESESLAGRDQVIARVWFDYEGHRVEPYQPGQFITQENDEQGNGETLLRRDHSFERQSLANLVPLGLRANPNDREQSMVLAERSIPNLARTLTDQGWFVRIEQSVVRRAAPVRLSISSGIDWFELHGGMSFDTETGEQTISLPEILSAARAGKHMVTLNDGSKGLLPTDWLERQNLLAAVTQVEADHLRFHQTQAAILDAMLDQAELVEIDQTFAQARQRLREFESIEPQHENATFAGVLRPYQREGLGWLQFLRWFGTGGILADDMGLGKTVQVLAILDSLYIKSAADPNATRRHPSLIVAPRSIIFNWIDEARRFVPDLSIADYSGSDRHTVLDTFDAFDVIVTSYGLMRRDVLELIKYEFEYVVLDEAQAIKNPASQSAKSARLLRAKHRLALSGTPVENHLGDLWSIFEFLNPGMLGTSGRFGELVRSGVNDLRSKDAAIQAAKALRPFILRRTKKQVLDELPEKTEQTIVCEMGGEQRRIYNELLNHYRKSLLQEIGSEKIGGSSMMVLEALLRLRQATCHPGLIDQQYEQVPSAKLDLLIEQLHELIDEGHKALVFSQFTSFLALVRKRFVEDAITYTYLDGKTTDRQSPVERFQNDPACSVFLISLKAGGLGLNLTAADYVFILDPWWNPAVEQQAIDRAHRIGQTRHVFAYRLICQDSVEQRIIELQQAKRKLADAIVGGQGGLLKNLTKKDLQRLLS